MFDSIDARGGNRSSGGNLRDYVSGVFFKHPQSRSLTQSCGTLGPVRGGKWFPLVEVDGAKY